MNNLTDPNLGVMSAASVLTCSRLSVSGDDQNSAGAGDEQVQG